MRTILIVDPSRVARAVLCRCLAAFPDRVVEAADGLQGVAAARRQRPDLIIATAETLATLHADASCRGVPTLALVAAAARGAAPASPGIVGHLAKPFNRRAVEEAVADVLGVPAPPAAAEAPGYTVLRLPDVRVTSSDAVLAAVIRALVDEGRDTLILDLARVTEANTALVGDLVRVITAARGAGMRTAICAPDARVRQGLAQGLAQHAETRDAPCAPTPAAVRERLA